MSALVAQGRKSLANQPAKHVTVACKIMLVLPKPASEQIGDCMSIGNPHTWGTTELAGNI